MSINSSEPYKPKRDFVHQPGQILKGIIEDHGVSQAELARRTGRSEKDISRLISGKMKLTHDMAILLERALGIKARFWNNLASNFEEFQSYQAEQARLKAGVSDFPDPLRLFLVKHNWIKAPPRDLLTQFKEILNFYHTATPKALQTCAVELTSACLFSKRSDHDPLSLTAWLIRGEAVFQSLPLPAYNSKAFRDSLWKARNMTLLEPRKYLPALQELCGKNGVGLLYVPAPPGAKVFGASRWFKDSDFKPCIMLSLRKKTDDLFWFNFFHEAFHVLLHSSAKKAVRISDDNFWDADEGDAFESEANRAAGELLIPSADFENFCQPITRNCIIEYSERLGVAPGIILGRLQFEKHIGYGTRLESLKKKVDFSCLDSAA